MKRMLIGSLSIAMAVCTSGGKANAASPTFSTVYEFQGTPDAQWPLAPPASDKNGVLYVAGEYGGSHGRGAIVSFTPPAAPGGAWTEKILHNFRGTKHRDGGYPAAPLLVGEDGSLYGTAGGGGEPAGVYGNVFVMKPPISPAGSWDLVTLYTFTGGSDGWGPGSGVVRGRGGVLYGTTIWGGAYLGDNCPYGCGTVFSLTPPAAPGDPWTESILYRFTDANGDGFDPNGSLVVGPNGVLYGTCSGGGTGYGTVFELAPPASPGGGWTETIIHSFTEADGSYDGPNPGVVLGSDGSLYGATPTTSAHYGDFFQLTPPTSPSGTWTETTLFTFGKHAGILSTGIIMGSKGEFYGTTISGGDDHDGTIFRLTPPATAGDTWHRDLLYSFPQVKGFGAHPGSLALGSSGQLYGTTYYGGSGPCRARGHHFRLPGCGTAFELVP